MMGTQGEHVVFVAAGADVQGAPGGWGLLKVRRNGSLSAIPLYDGAIVGAASGQRDDVISVRDATDCPHHAQFLVRPDGVYVSDLDSPTGTWLDGVPVSMLGLAHGSVLRMGDSVMLFVERELDTYAGTPSVMGDVVIGVRQRTWMDAAVGHIENCRSLVIQGASGVGKSTMARAAIQRAGGMSHTYVVDGASIDPDQLIRAYGEGGPTLWLVTHIDQMPRAAQSDLVRAVRATEGSMLIGTVVGALEDAHAEGRVGSSLMSLVETRVLRVPSLAERREDIPALTIELLRRVGIRLDAGAEAVFECVLRAGWPGGVRELGAQLAAAFDAAETPERAAKILCRTVPRSCPKEPLALQMSDMDLARVRLQKALAMASGTVAVAARELRMSRQAFYRELRRLGTDASR
jgi:hypothetical protein